LLSGTEDEMKGGEGRVAGGGVGRDWLRVKNGDETRAYERLLRCLLLTRGPTRGCPLPCEYWPMSGMPPAARVPYSSTKGHELGNRLPQ